MRKSSNTEAGDRADWDVFTEVVPEAKGLSASTGARLKQVWRAEYDVWRQRRVDHEQWVSI